MIGRAFSAIQIVNIVLQAIFNLLWQIGLAVLIGWLCVDKWGAPGWVYVPVIMLGVFSGLYSMVRFIISASAGAERIEKERAAEAKRKAREAEARAQRKETIEKETDQNGDNNG